MWASIETPSANVVLQSTHLAANVLSCAQHMILAIRKMATRCFSGGPEAAAAATAGRGRRRYAGLSNRAVRTSMHMEWYVAAYVGGAAASTPYRFAYLRRKLDEAMADKVAPDVAALITELCEALVAEPAMVRLGAGVHPLVDLEFALVPEPLRADRAVELEELARVQPDLVTAQRAKVAKIFRALVTLERPEVLVDALVRREQAALPKLLRVGPGVRPGGEREREKVSSLAARAWCCCFG